MQFSALLLLGLWLPLARSHPEVSSRSANVAWATAERRHHENTPASTANTEPITARAAQPAHGPIDAFNDAMNNHEDKQESKSSASVASKDSVAHSKADAEAGITDTGVYERGVDPPNAQVTATPTQDRLESPPNGNFNDPEARDDGDHALDAEAPLDSEFSAAFATTSTSYAHVHRHAHKTTNTGPITPRAAQPAGGGGGAFAGQEAERQRTVESRSEASVASVSASIAASISASLSEQSTFNTHWEATHTPDPENQAFAFLNGDGATNGNGDFYQPEARDDGAQPGDEDNLEAEAPVDSAFAAGFTTTSTSHAHGNRHAQKTTGDTGPITPRAAQNGQAYVLDPKDKSVAQSKQRAKDASRKSAKAAKSASESKKKCQEAEASWYKNGWNFGPYPGDDVC